MPVYEQGNRKVTGDKYFNLTKTREKKRIEQFFLLRYVLSKQLLLAGHVLCRRFKIVKITFFFFF